MSKIRLKEDILKSRSTLPSTSSLVELRKPTLLSRPIHHLNQPPCSLNIPPVDVPVRHGVVTRHPLSSLPSKLSEPKVATCLRRAWTHPRPPASRDHNKHIYMTPMQAQAGQCICSETHRSIHPHSARKSLHPRL